MNNTIIAILNILNIMAELIELSVFVSVRVIALAIVIGQYTIEAVQFVYINRKSITEKMNPFNGLMSLWELSTFTPSALKILYIKRVKEIKRFYEQRSTFFSRFSNS